MGRALDVSLKVIPAKVANPFVKRVHYSGKVVGNSSLHFGAFLDGRLHGVMSFGPSMDKSKLIGLVEGTGWSNFIELNRMAFDDVLPRNSESRCISLAMRAIKRKAPQVKWVVSFADGCQCGDGTIYRASNFVLTGIRKNGTIYEFPNGERVSNLRLNAHPSDRLSCLGGKSMLEITGGKISMKAVCEATGAKAVPGYMLRYVYFIDPKWRKRLTVPEIPFSRIDELGAGMYRGERVTLAERHVGNWPGGVLAEIIAMVAGPWIATAALSHVRRTVRAGVMRMGDPRTRNGNARRKLRARLRAEGRPCHICGQPIDYSLPSGHPWSFEVDEIVPVSRGGSPLDYANVDAAHRICNQRRGNRMPGDEGAKGLPIVRTRLW